MPSVLVQLTYCLPFQINNARFRSKKTSRGTAHEARRPAVFGRKRLASEALATLPVALSTASETDSVVSLPSCADSSWSSEGDPENEEDHTAVCEHLVFLNSALELLGDDPCLPQEGEGMQMGISDTAHITAYASQQCCTYRLASVVHSAAEAFDSLWLHSLASHTAEWEQAPSQNPHHTGLLTLSNDPVDTVFQM